MTKRPTRRRRPGGGFRSRLANGTFRLWSAFCVVAFCLTLFTARLVQLQGIDENDYAAMAIADNTTTVTLDAPRASIYDRNGVPLAESVDAEKLVADPTFTTKDATRIATLLHQRLGLDYLQTVTALRTPNTRYVELAGHLLPSRAEQMVKELTRLHLPGVYTEKDTMRIYPSGDVAANLVGFVGHDNTGLFGLEQADNRLLRGTNGSETYEMADGQQLPLAHTSITPPKEGTGIRLTIDQDLQFLAQKRLAQAVKSSGGLSGVAVVQDVHTGQLLALADYPTFNPNDYAQADPADFGSRALQDVYEPGSVEKVLTFSALIDKGLISPRTHLTVPAEYVEGPDVIHDYFYHGTLHLTATGVVAKSSNIGTVIAAKRISNAGLYDYLRKFGLGRPTGIGIPGEAPGLLAKPGTWRPIRHDNIAFGQGVSVNAVQMSSAIAAVANGGVYVQPSLIEGHVHGDGSFTPAPAPHRHRVISPATAHAVTRMMEAVVGPEGTAPVANVAGYQVAGKTGTAQRAGPNGTYDGTFTVSFAGFAPAESPRFVVYVVIQRPTAAGAGGGVTAGPVFHDLMAAALQKYGVPPSGKHDPVLPAYW